jgi:beta-lactamase class A
MIRFSSNAAATRVLDRVGREELLEIIQSFKFRLYDPEHGGGLWVGKDYAKKGAFQRDPLKNLSHGATALQVARRDPLKNLSHGATALQVARFYYLLDTNRLVNPELTLQMKEILSNPGISHKFVRGLESLSDVKIYRKSGSWKDYHADSALIEYQGHKYIIVGLARHPGGGKWLESLALPLHELIVKETIKEQ